MAPKRPSSPEFIANPFIKKRNLDWTLQATAAQEAEAGESHNLGIDSQVSPTAAGNNQAEESKPESQSAAISKPTTAAVESGAASTDDHLAFFASSLRSRILTRSSGDEPDPLLSISSYEELYRAHAGSTEGAHFVIHQHDHPVAGTHYDLRLQINETSSVSWAIMYGLPGDPNSVRLNRNATETRIHCLWNHLIETASAETGSLLIWDTGTYSILPRRSKYAPAEDPSSPQGSPVDPLSAPSQQDLLHAAFQHRKIRLRLHGSKLPDPYVLNLRLTKSEDASGRARSARNLSTTPRKRRRNTRGKTAREKSPQDSTDQEEHDDIVNEQDGDDGHLVPQQTADGSEGLSALEKELRELEDDQVRRTNAYAGAFNTIGSIHQRRWYLSLDRPACGFERSAQQRWELQAKNDDKDEINSVYDQPRHETHPHGLSWPFYVHGADHEYSAVTGRRGAEILQDEDVTGFVPRMGWKPVLN